MKMTRPICPNCGMNMIVAAGFALSRECQVIECLRCGHLEKPTTEARVPPAAVAAAVGHRKRTAKYQ